MGLRAKPCFDHAGGAIRLSFDLAVSAIGEIAIRAFRNPTRTFLLDEVMGAFDKGIHALLDVDVISP